MKLDEIPTPLQSSVLSTLSCLRTKFEKEEELKSKRLRNVLEWLDRRGYKISGLSEGFQLSLFSFANFRGD